MLRSMMMPRSTSSGGATTSPTGWTNPNHSSCAAIAARVCGSAAITRSPQDPGLHHALGLLLTRIKRQAEALDELRRASELAPDRVRYAYVYAVALHSAGQREQATTVPKKILSEHPDDRDTIQAIMAFARDAGDVATALEYAKKLAQLAPNDPNVKALVESLQSKADSPAAR